MVYQLNYEEVKSIRELLRDVISATKLHRTVVSNNRKLNARISKSTLKDMDEGMGISLDKLNETIDKLNDSLDDVEMRFTNFYKHCGVKWEDTWSCACDDECPVCGHSISPYKTKDAE